jgi:hypothetical protein
MRIECKHLIKRKIFGRATEHVQFTGSPFFSNATCHLMQGQHNRQEIFFEAYSLLNSRPLEKKRFKVAKQSVSPDIKKRLSYRLVFT